MPQLVPFYFFNQVFFILFLLSLLIYIFSSYILPKNVYIYITRIFIKNL